MQAVESNRSERFLKLFRQLEGLLEKRYAAKRVASGSVVMEYLHDPDSAPCRADLDMCREIRNLLSHSADESGEPVIEPSESALALLEDIVEYVRRPRLAIDRGTPGDKILFAHPNDSALDVMRHMMRMGYSHVPVRERNTLVGVLSASSLMSFVCASGFEKLQDGLRVGDMKRALEIRDDREEKYLFFDRKATLTAVRAAFEKKKGRNSRVAVAFITEDGDMHSQVLAMLTPWDLLKNAD